METFATFSILLIIYFLGSLALVQLVIRPIRKEEFDSSGARKIIKTNYLKILAVSMVLSLATTTVAYLIFP